MRGNNYVILLFCAVGIMLCFTTCDQHPNINPLDPAYDETLGLTTSAPLFDPVPETWYTAGQAVTITCADEGASIYYTIGGETPTVSSVNLYSAPITIDSDTTISAVALKEGYAVSPVVSGIYYIIGEPSTPSSFAANAVEGRLMIQLSWDQGSVIESGFKIERKTGVGGIYTEIADLGSNTVSYEDSCLSPETTYYYRMCSYNGLGSSEYTEEKNGTTPAQTVTEHVISDAILDTYAVHATDIDGDGDTDILGSGVGNSDITWWENTAGDGSAWTQRQTGSHPVTTMVAADIDGDGDMDIVGTTPFSVDKIFWVENSAASGDGSTWEVHYVIESGYDNPVDIDTADMDADGDLDILGISDTNNTIYWWKNTAGDGSTWQQVSIGSAYDSGQSVHAADMDGDGDMDVVTTASGTVPASIIWWENTSGDGSTWTENTLSPTFTGGVSACAADLDSDGDMDIIGANRNGDTLAWWENTGNENFTYHDISTSYDGPNDIYTEDIDGDGDIDLVSAAYAAGVFSWWENDGSEVFTEHTLSTGFGGAWTVHVNDVDGDGDTDILGAAMNDSKIAWWEMVF